MSLINGGWNVTAAQNILLQEVRNPNGDFDYNGGSAYNHYFDYAAGDYVDLSAGYQVQLGASVKLPRLSSKMANLYNVPVIYPSILNITAGDGGVILGPGSPTALPFSHRRKAVSPLTRRVLWSAALMALKAPLNFLI